jgi:transcriptional repressor NrdR
MHCPFCDYQDSRVVDTTKNAPGGIRRRRECLQCGERFSTLERPILGTPLLIKKDGSRESFDRDKLIQGIQIACGKRPVSAADIERLTGEIEAGLQRMGKSEVSSRVVGDMVIQGLKELDYIAYIRYAIVYLQLDDLKDIRLEIDRLLSDEP